MVVVYIGTLTVYMILSGKGSFKWLCLHGYTHGLYNLSGKGSSKWFGLHGYTHGLYDFKW